MRLNDMKKSETPKEQIGARIDALAKKRDHAADVLNKPMLAWSYQIEIDRLAEALSPSDTTAEQS
jgi:hypothetical protein